jgi:hypothetical protein
LEKEDLPSLATGEEDRPRNKAKKNKGFPSRRQLARTSWGLGFHYAKLLTYATALPVLIVCNLVVTIVFASGARDVVAFFGAVGLVAAVGCGIVSPALGMTGSALCCRVSSRTGGRPFLIAALTLDATVWVLPLASMLSAAANPAFKGFGTTTHATVFALVLIAAAFLWTGASLIMFILFLRKLVHVLEDVGMANEGREIVVRYSRLLIAAPIMVAAAIVLTLYLSQDFTSAYDFTCAVFAPQTEAVETREWGIGIAVALVLGIWLLAVIKVLVRMLNLIGSLRYLLRARYGV